MFPIIRYKDAREFDKQKYDVVKKNLAENKDCSSCAAYDANKGIGYCSVKKKYQRHHYICYRHALKQ